MQVNLINGYYIELKTRNFTLKQKYIGTKKDGTKKESVKIISHCVNLKHAIETFLRLNQIPNDSKLAVDLMEYVNLIEKSNKEAVRALESVLEGKETEVDACEWKHDDEEYETGCNQKHLIFDGSLYDNDYKYCPYCGKKIKVVE